MNNNFSVIPAEAGIQIEEKDMNFLPQLISALIIVESGGNFRAVGDGGQALGILQIHREVINDVNRIYRTRFKHADALNPALAREICELYLQHYGQAACENSEDPDRLEIYARIWNGGPNGHHKPATLEYWDKVRAELEKGGYHARN